MPAAPLDLISDMASIQAHWHEGIELQQQGCFTPEEWSEHQAISYSALVLLGVDGMIQLCRRCALEEAMALG